jgi:hypothetical protein
MATVPGHIMRRKPARGPQRSIPYVICKNQCSIGIFTPYILGDMNTMRVYLAGMHIAFPDTTVFELDGESCMIREAEIKDIVSHRIDGACSGHRFRIAYPRMWSWLGENRLQPQPTPQSDAELIAFLEKFFPQYDIVEFMARCTDTAPCSICMHYSTYRHHPRAGVLWH